MKSTVISLSAAVLAMAAAVSQPAFADDHDFARQELQHHLALKADEVNYRFVFEKPADAPDPKPFESCYRIDGDTVWFWGDDSGPEEMWNWGDNRGLESQRHNGTLFAVELFAERELGMHFLWAGKDGISVSRVKTLVLPLKAEGSYVSTLLKARIRSYPTYHKMDWSEVGCWCMPRELYDRQVPPSTHEERILWQKRNRLQDKAYFQYGHAFTKWKDRFLKTKPELLNLHYDKEKGTTERGWTGTEKSDRTKMCVSNEAVVDQILADWMAAGTNRFLNVCENDSARWCECPNCRALDCPKEGEDDLAHMTDRYVNLWNRIARRAKAIRPDVMLVSYIYSAYRFPPRRERLECGENMLCGFVCAETEDCMEMIRAWNRAGMKNFFLRPNYFHTIVTLHRGLERYFFDQFHELLKLGMIGCDYDANDNRPTTSLEFYVIARAFADPTLSFESIMADYLTGYGAAAKEVGAYFDEVRKTGEAARDLAQAAKLEGGGYYEEFKRLRKDVPLTEEFGRNEKEILEKKAMLDRAVARHEKAKDLTDVEMRRLRSLRLQAEHGLLTFRFLSGVVNATVPEMKAAADALNAFRLAHVEDLPDIYTHIYRLWWAEVRYWKLYKKRLAGK